MKKHEVYQRALMLTRILKGYGIEITAKKARELIIERDNVTLDHDFLRHMAPNTSAECRDDLGTVMFYALKTIADIAFCETPGRSTSLKVLLSQSRNFYGLEISNPYRTTSRSITISDMMLENMGSILAYEIIHALTRRDLSDFADDDFIDAITHPFLERKR